MSAVAAVAKPAEAAIADAPAVEDVSGYTAAELAAMTPQEREAIGAELDDKGPSVVVDSEALPAAVAPAAPAVVVPAVAPAAVAEPAVVVDAVPDTADVSPVVATIKASKVVSDADHEAAQAALAKKFEDGEVTTPQFIIENEKLTREKLNSDLAAQSGAQGEDAIWQARQAAFFATPGNAVIRDDPRVWAAMQAELESMYVKPEFKDYTDMQFLNAAGKAIRTLFGLEAPAPAVVVAAKPAAKPAAAAVPMPVTLAGTPAAADNVDGVGEFAHMDKLEGMEYELAVAKMPKEQRDRFLAI